MKLDDVLLYVIVDPAGGEAPLDALCRDAIEAGADAIEMPAPATAAGRAVWEAARRACREGVALCVAGGCDAGAIETDADAVRLDADRPDIGLARAGLGSGGVVGVASRTRVEAELALETGADFVLHFAGRDAAGDFAALRGRARAPLFAAGLEGLNDARALIEAGVHRFCLETRRLGKAPLRETVAGFARLLGRIV